MKRVSILLTAIAAASGAAAQDPLPAPFAAGPVAGSDLARIVGQADIAQEIRAQNSSTVSHNSVSGVSETGTISFDAQAFNNLSGLSLLSANTGNNVSINSSLNLNVTLHP